MQKKQGAAQPYSGLAFYNTSSTFIVYFQALVNQPFISLL